MIRVEMLLGKRELFELNNKKALMRGKISLSLC
jgi:hypothetical protein